MLHNISDYIKEHLLLIIILLCIFLVLAFFHEILTPFVIALIVVYLIEPLVKRMNRVKIRGHRLPRGVAVLITYLVFVLGVTGICLAFIPSLTEEISQATHEVPQFLNRVKDEDIPRWSRNIDELVYKFSIRDKHHASKDIQDASKQVGNAWQKASSVIKDSSIAGVDTSGQVPLLIQGERVPGNQELIDAANAEIAEPPVLFKFKQTGKGSYDVMPGNQPIVIQPAKDGSYTIVIQDTSKPASQNNFSLERELSKAASGFVESSTQFAGSALSFIQYAIEFVINTFIQLILVFMLAAFISIDLPNLLKCIRNLFADEKEEASGYDEYMHRLAKGLSGVVQGQLIICCINGTLTGIGLTILGVDFALLLGIIAGILSIVPIFGTIISKIPAVLLGLVQGPLSAVLVLGWILLVHFCDTNFFTPKIVGSSTNLHPVIIIFALLAGQQCAGVLGLILAVPTVSIIQTTIKFILEKSRHAENTETSDEAKTETSEDKTEISEPHASSPSDSPDNTETENDAECPSDSDDDEDEEADDEDEDDEEDDDEEDDDEDEEDPEDIK